MRFRKAVNLAWGMLIHSKIRSWLTIIGIIIGIAAVVSIISISEGAKVQLQNQLSGLGADVITISPGATRALGSSAEFRSFGGESGGKVVYSSGNSGTYNLQSASTVKNLTSKDISAIKTVPNVQYVMGTLAGNAKMTYLAKSSNVRIEGVDPSIWTNFMTTGLESGRYLIQSDSNAIVVGYNVANTIFSKMSINHQVTINNTAFTVVGILKQSGATDSEVYMPTSTARKILGDANGKDFDSIQVKISDSSTSATNQTITAITKELMMERGILQEKNIDFSVTSPVSIQERISSTISSLSIFLAAIAAISLLVGAIGISNTMFTSVLEKTKEIGILKAIGAKNRDILGIFLLKSGMLGLVGGFGGVLIGILGSLIIGQIGGLSIGLGRGGATSYISPWLIVGSFIVSMFIGMVAGVIPAYRASRLKPVDALRYE